MNIKKIEEVVKLMEKHGLTEISVEEEGVKIHLKKGSSGTIEQTLEMRPHILAPATQEASPAQQEKQNVVEIKAPMVGTFYKSPSPDSNPFVEVGGKVAEGDVVCVIEAMKLMNEIKSEVKGKIVDVLVGNGEPVEFGQIMFLVEPA